MDSNCVLPTLTNWEGPLGFSLLSGTMKHWMGLGDKQYMRGSIFPFGWSSASYKLLSVEELTSLSRLKGLQVTVSPSLLTSRVPILFPLNQDY